MTTATKDPRKTEGYKPNVIPQALKAIKDISAEIRPGSWTGTTNLNNPTGKGREPMNTQTEVNINGASYVMAVKNLEQTIQFYSELGFKYEMIGSKVKHHHVSRGKLTFIFVEAQEVNEVRPMSSIYPEQYFDVFVYTDAVDLFAQEIKSKNIPLTREPHYTRNWSEFTFRDINGYQIAIGGGIVNKELI